MSELELIKEFLGKRITGLSDQLKIHIAENKEFKQFVYKEINRLPDESQIKARGKKIEELEKTMGENQQELKTMFLKVQWRKDTIKAVITIIATTCVIIGLLVRLGYLKP